MTYCLAMRLREGLVFLSDTRTSAGVDNLSTYRKQHVITVGKDPMGFAFAPDGKTVLYIDGDDILQKVTSEGGPSQKAFDHPVFSRITISPDGKLAAFVTHHQRNDPKEKLVLLSLDSGQLPRYLEFERPRVQFQFSYTIGPVAFSPDGKGIVYPTRNGETDNL